MDKKWEIKSSEYALDCKWLKVRKDRIKMPTGVELDDFYVLEYPDWINIIAITTDGYYVLERQYRHGLQKTSLEICAGTIEKGEDPLIAAKRELLEETGYGEGEWSLFMTSAPNPAAMTNVNYTFIAKGVKKITEQHLEHSEDIDILLVSENELISYMINGEIVQGIMLAPLWRWMRDNNK